MEWGKEREFANREPGDGDLGDHAIKGKEAKGLEEGRKKTTPRCRSRTGGAKSNTMGLEAVAGGSKEDNETQGPAEAVVETLAGVTA